MPGFDGVVSATLTALVGAFLGAFFSRFAGLTLPILKAGQYADQSSAQKIIGYVQAAEANLTLVALLSALVVLLARSITKGGIGA